ncbi:MAG: LexA family protein, partial [Caldisericaceae bacterium]
ILGYVRAGEPLELVDLTEPLGEVLVPEKQTKDSSFAVIVKGDSMKDRGIEDGDKLIVDPESCIESGNLVIALIENRATFKRYRKVGDKVFLEPANDKYEKIYLTPDMDVRLLRVKTIIKNV